MVSEGVIDGQTLVQGRAFRMAPANTVRTRFSATPGRALLPSRAHRLGPDSPSPALFSVPLGRLLGF